jgi:hypothetical protein
VGYEDAMIIETGNRNCCIDLLKKNTRALIGFQLHAIVIAKLVHLLNFFTALFKPLCAAAKRPRWDFGWIG